MESAIEVKNLVFSYNEKGPDTITDISFSIPKGSYTTIIGHNGSGKSTIAKLLIGLLSAKSGEISLLSETINDDNMYDLRRRVGIVFQNPDNQFIGSTVADDIAFGLENHCVPNEQMQPIIEKVAKSVGMENYLEKEPTHLSGGQKQRVAIAGVLAMEPDIVIFDESTSMLDPQGKATINEQIRSLHAEKEMTVVSITHDMEEVAQSEYVLVLSKGKIVMRGTPQEVFEHADQLKELRLDVPFATQVAKALKQEGIQMEESLNIEQVVNQLCQLKSNT